MFKKIIDFFKTPTPIKKEEFIKHKKPFKPIMVHSLFVEDGDCIIKGRKLNSKRLLLEITNQKKYFEDHVEDYINVLKEQIPESINNCEHIFLPCIEDNRFDIIERQEPNNIKHILYITLRNNTTGQKDDEYIKNFRKFVIKNLNNTLEYFEILIKYFPEQDYTSFYIINLK
jgi:hypothetical protein